VPAAGVEYRVAPADRSGLPDHSVALVTVAQALHWFDFDSFYAEVRRVTVRGGVIAVWSYGACHIGEDLDPEIHVFQENTVGKYWDPGRRWVDEEYRTIPFPFAELKAPTLELHKQWSLTQLGGYLRSWSAVAKYVKERGEDPVIPLLERLANRWGSADVLRDVRWPLALRVGRVE
jgi:hypothetical protein